MKHLDKLREYLPTLGSGATLNEEWLDECLDEIRSTLLASVKGRKPSISPSQTSNAPRYFKHILEGNTNVFNPDQFKPQARLKMLLNSINEHIIVLLMKEAGIDVKAPKNKVTIKIETPAGREVEMHGSYDYTIDDKIVDMKVVNKDNYSGKFKNATALANHDIFGYLLQGRLYEIGEGKDFYGWDVFCGDDMRFKHVSSLKIQDEVEQKLYNFGKNYDIACDADSVEDLALCYPVETHNMYGTPLGGTRIAWQCSRCAFRDQCFDGLREERKGVDGVRHWIEE